MANQFIRKKIEKMKKILFVLILTPNISFCQFKIKDIILNGAEIIINKQNLIKNYEVLYFKEKYEAELILKLNESEKVYCFNEKKHLKYDISGFVYENNYNYYYFDAKIDQFIYSSKTPFRIYIYDKNWVLKKIILVNKMRIRGFYDVQFINDKYYMIFFHNCFSKKIFTYNMSKKDNFTNIIKMKRYRTNVLVNSDFDVRYSTLNFE